LALPIATIGVFGTPQMVFTNSIMTIHVNRIVDRPSMSSMVVGGYKNVSAMDSKGRYQEPFVVIELIINHKDGYYVKPNRVAFKYIDLKKHVDLNAHVKMFKFVVKTNVKTFEKYIINAFSYKLRDTTSSWYYNYMLGFLDCTFSRLIQAFYKHHWKT